MDSKSTPPPTSRPVADAVPLTLTFCVISALLIFLVYAGNFVFGSKDGNWDYPYFKTINSIPLWIPATALILIGIAIFVGSKLIHSYEKITLLACFLIAFIFQGLIHRVYPVSIGTIVQSDTSNSFYSLALRYSPLEILAQYNQLAPSFPLHARTNMPGKIILFQLFTPFISSPRIMGYLVILISTLGAFLLYGICMKLFHDRQTAFYAFILYALIPCKLFFFPILNTVTPLFILLCFYLYLAYLEKKRMVFLWLLGGALYLLVLFEPTPLVTGIIFIGILLKAIADKRFSKRDFWALLIIPVLGFLIVFLFFSVLFSFNLLQAFQYVLKDAVDFNSRENRPYWIWVAENPKEFFYGVGLPVMMIFIYLAIQALHQLKLIKFNLFRWSIENVFILSLLATLCVVVFLGINRGEITRLWVYLAVFFQVPAASFLGKIPKSEVLFFIVAGTLFAQSIVTLQRVGFIIP
jgi:methylthioxylose transferase